MRKRTVSVCFALIIVSQLVLLPSGCGRQEPAPLNETAGLYTDLEYLCKMGEGRLPGSQGNILAQDYIKNAFESAGLNYYSGYYDFCVPYEQELFCPESQHQVLTAVYRDGSEKQFYSGVDFYPALCTKFEISGIVTTDCGDPDLSDKIYLGSDVPDNAPIYQIRPGDKQSATLEYKFPTLSVSDTLFDELSGSVSLTFSGTLNVERATVNNVIGVWEGRSGKDALVISAHFDHVGQYGKTVYTGALDNASGVAVMLEILRQTAAAQIQPEYDIVFCAFNGEDMGQLGSKAFSELPFQYERMNVINIDTIGWNGSDSLAINAGEEALAKQVAEVMSEAGYFCEIGDFGRSDHNMLCDNGIPAVTIASGGDVASVIHSTADRLDVLNVEQLLNIATAIQGNIGTFTLANQAELSDQDLDELSEMQALQAKEMVEKYQPGKDEMVLYQSDDFWVCARDTSPIADLKEVFNQYPNIDIPKELGSYQFESFHPSGFPDKDTGKKSVARSYYAMDKDPLAKELREGVYPLDESLFVHMNSIRYCNDQGKSVDVIIYPLDGWKMRVEESHGTGETYYAGTEAFIVFPSRLEVVYECDATSSVISLSCPIDAVGTDEAVSLDELEKLMEQELTEIQRITYIP